MLYDNLEFDKSRLRDHEQEEREVKPRPTTMEEYDDNYYWNDIDMNRASVQQCVAIIKQGLKS